MLHTGFLQNICSVNAKIAIFQKSVTIESIAAGSYYENADIDVSIPGYTAIGVVGYNYNNSQVFCFGCRVYNDKSIRNKMYLGFKPMNNLATGTFTAYIQIMYFKD